MVLVGHTHTHEFAAGGTTDQVGNPWAPELVAGGSSGGSAAALAARMVPAALGSDTCGSLRIPSACCGTSAIKPTHGRLPLDGIIPLAPTLDHPGPMARTIADCAALLAAMAADGPPANPLTPPPRVADGAAPAAAAGLPSARAPDDRGDGSDRRARAGRGRRRGLRARAARVRGARRADRRAALAVDVRLGRPQPRADERDVGLPRVSIPASHRSAIARRSRSSSRSHATSPTRRPTLPPSSRRAAGTAAWEDWFSGDRRRSRARADAADRPLRPRPGLRPREAPVARAIR